MRISFVLPFFKKAPLFEKSIMLNEQYYSTNAEVICALDEPTDEYRVVAAVRNRLRAKVVVNDIPHEWRPPSRAINVGVRHATGEWVCILSPESLLILPRLDFLQQLASEVKEPAIYGGLLWHFHAAPEDSLHVWRSNLAEAQKRGPRGFGYGFTMCERARFDAICGMDEARQKYGGDDDDIRTRLIRSGATMRVIKDICIFHPHHGNSPRAQMSEPLWPEVAIERQRGIWGTSFGRVAYDSL